MPEFDRTYLMAYHKDVMRHFTDVSVKTNNHIVDIVQYLQEWNIKNVVIGVSGGIDSAFTLMLLLKAKEKHDFNIHTMFFKHGLHTNEASEQIVSDFVKAYPEVNHSVIDISGIIKSTNDIDGNEDAIIDTQYAYALMYTLLFRKAQQVGGITFGSTNKDEFDIGWFGKTSDMVVDIQPIHDFRKWEIYDSYLSKNIPDSIIGKSPNGDLLSGKTDEEIFGCSYIEVGALMELRETYSQVDRAILYKHYPMLKEVIESNRHKLVKPKNEFNPIFL